MILQKKHNLFKWNKPIQRAIIILLIFLIIPQIVYAYTTHDILKYKNQKVILIINSLIPYSIKGTILETVKTSTSEFVIIQTNDYYNYTNGIAFININSILKILD